MVNKNNLYYIKATRGGHYSFRFLFFILDIIFDDDVRTGMWRSSYQ